MRLKTMFAMTAAVFALALLGCSDDDPTVDEERQSFRCTGEQTCDGDESFPAADLCITRSEADQYVDDFVADCQDALRTCSNRICAMSCEERGNVCSDGLRFQRSSSPAREGTR